MNRPPPETVRRRFLVALGHAIHLTWSSVGPSRVSLRSVRSASHESGAIGPQGAVAGPIANASCLLQPW